jgi:hypothetical protein
MLAVLGVLAAGCGTTRTVTVTTTTHRPALGAAQFDQDPVTVPLPAAGIRCGSELWPIKTLTDPGAADVQLDPVVPTTIGAINNVPLPADPTTRAVDNFELHAYQVTAFIIGYKLEDDNDWHVVLSDDGSEEQPHTIIVELPNPACAQPPLEAATSRVLEPMIEARAAFETAFPPAKACFVCGLKTQVTALGIGFFDRLHHQHGVGPKGAELHPVIGFQLGGVTPAKALPALTPTTPPKQPRSKSCNRYPGRHWLAHKYHRSCRANFTFTKSG